MKTPVLPSSLISILDDILHVRLQTLGVTEHSFNINVAGTHYSWLLYDVGGAVSFQRPCLYPFLVDRFLEVERPGKRPTFRDKPPRHLTACDCSGMHGCLTLKMVSITGSLSPCEGPASFSFCFFPVLSHMRGTGTDLSPHHDPLHSNAHLSDLPPD